MSTATVSRRQLFRRGAEIIAELGFWSSADYTVEDYVSPDAKAPVCLSIALCKANEELTDSPQWTEELTQAHIQLAKQLGWDGTGDDYAAARYIYSVNDTYSGHDGEQWAIATLLEAEEASGFD